MQSGLSLRIITSDHFFKRVNGLVDLAVVQRNLPYRIDLLNNDTVSSIRTNEIVICLHDRKITTNASLLHESGSLCAHWVLGSPQQNPDELWPFLHEHQSRLFWGKNAINEWVNLRKSIPITMERNSSVH